MSDEPQAATHLTGGEDGRADGRPAPEHRTFLIADIRGYTPYTDQFGDEAAAALARRFAELARQAVEGRQGTLLELRGDEAVAHFASARQALRAAVDLQGLVKSENLPRRVGIGLDTGEAVAVDEGYRGTALNIAARLCALARPGQIIATETVIHLAARIDGVRYGSPRSLRLKGLAAPMRVVDVIAAADAGPPGDGRPTRSPFMRRPVLAALVGVGTIVASAFILTRTAQAPPGSQAPSGISPSPASAPVTWLGDLKAGDGKRALYLNVAVDANANVYGADRLGNRVVVWDATGTPASWGSRGSGPGEFDFGEVTTGDQSQSVAIAPDGRVAVGDGGNHRVQVFDADGTFRSAIGREGTGNGEFINPCCVAFGSNGRRVYVADPGRGDIQVFDQDGNFIRVIGSKGSGNGQFSRLGVPFVDPRDGNLWVPDYANRRVQVVTPAGGFVANYGTGQNGNPRLAEVNGVVLDSVGRMFIVDTSNVVYVLDRQGRLVTRFGPEIAGAGFVAAASLALTPDGKLYLPDAKFPGGDRIVVIQLTPPLWPP